MRAHLQRSTIAAIVVALGFTVTTAVAALHHPLVERCSKRQAAQRELSCARRALWQHEHAALWIKNHKTRTLATASWPTSSYWRSRLKYERWRARVDRRLVAEARARLAPRIAHLALWLCIHGGEGAWSDTGDPYWGGLQMHPGWGYGTSWHASDDSPLVQMQSAERAYRASGFSTAWLEGQWPNTSPPCLGFA